LGCLGAAIEQERKLLGLTQEELADRSDVHPTHLSGVERGARNPTYQTLVQIAEKGLKTTPGALVMKADKLYARSRRRT
jgi:transcriptional regulator with XRE-family HTH domain